MDTEKRAELVRRYIQADEATNTLHTQADTQTSTNRRRAPHTLQAQQAPTRASKRHPRYRYAEHPQAGAALPANIATMSSTPASNTIKRLTFMGGPSPPGLGR